MCETLITEGCDGFRRILAEILRARFPQMNITEAGEPGVTFASLQSCEPQLVFVDLQAGNGGGLALLESLRERLPYSILIALVDPEHARCEDASAFGADFTLSTRSWSLVDLVSLADSLLNVLQGLYVKDEPAVQRAPVSAGRAARFASPGGRRLEGLLEAARSST